MDPGVDSRVDWTQEWTGGGLWDGLWEELGRCQGSPGEALGRTWGGPPGEDLGLFLAFLGVGHSRMAGEPYLTLQSAGYTLLVVISGPWRSH